MSLSAYFEEHEEQAFVAKALATAVGIILIKNYLSGFVSFLLLIFPVVFLIGIRMHALASGVDAMDLLREHITFFPMMRSEADRRSEVKPWVTYSLILANILIFYGFEINASRETIDNLAFLPQDPDPFNVVFSAFSYMFLHAGNGHLWGNMTFLWVVGTAVERRVGRLKFLWLYLLTGIIAGVAFVLVEYLFLGRAGHIVGASGAIAGIMGIFAIRCYFKSMIFPVPILGIFSLILPISLKIRLNSLMIMALFFLSDLSGGIDQITGESVSMVGHWAHLGGMISGILIAWRLKLGEDAVEERHLEIGVKASQKTIGFGDGERSLEKALERNPDNAEALLALARIKTKFTHTDAGKELYEKVIRLMEAARQGEVVEVFREYNSKYHTVPRDPALVSRLAEMLRTAGEVEYCIDCLEYLVKAEETAPPVREKSLFQLATLLEFTSRFDVARSHFARFAAEYPSSILAEKAREKAGNQSYTPLLPKVKPAAGIPPCPTCGATMAARPATSGAHQGKLFHVCSHYPACRTVLPVQEGEAVERRPAAKHQPERYQLVLDGHIPFTADPEEVKENVARLFRCERSRADRLFCGQETVVKKGLDHAAALRLKEALDATGALSAIKVQKDAAAPPPLPSPQPEAQVAPVAQEQAQAPRETPQAPPAPAEKIRCPKCGFEQEKGECCLQCGVYFAKVAGQAEREFHTFRDHLPGAAANRTLSEEQERKWAMWCHLLTLSGMVIPLGNFAGPLAIWLWKRKHSEFIDFHGKTALNYQLTLLLFGIGAGLVAALTGFAVFFTGPALLALGLYTLVSVISCARGCRRGDWTEIGLSHDFIK